MKENFDVSGYMNGRFTSSNPSMIGRLFNALISAINGKEESKTVTLLPKYIVVVPDDNIIKSLNHYGAGMGTALNKMIEKVMNEHEKALKIYCDYLPEKSKCKESPVIIWILAPMHDNFANNSERNLFNKCVQSKAKLHDNVVALQLKKVWDCTDTNLYIKENRRFTALGYTSYWQAIDKTVKYCDTILIKKILSKTAKDQKQPTFGKKKFNSTKKLHHFQQKQDKYHWRRQQHYNNANQRYKSWAPEDDSDISDSDICYKRKLPAPPKKRQAEF